MPHPRIQYQKHAKMYKSCEGETLGDERYDGKAGTDTMKWIETDNRSYKNILKILREIIEKDFFDCI